MMSSLWLFDSDFNLRLRDMTVEGARKRCEQVQRLPHKDYR